MSKLEPDIENTRSVHASGIYKGKRSKQLYFFFHNGILDPPTFPDTKQANQDEWDMIDLVDKRKLEAYISRITTTESRVRTIKKDVKMILIYWMTYYHSQKQLSYWLNLVLQIVYHLNHITLLVDQLFYLPLHIGTAQKVRNYSSQI